MQQRDCWPVTRDKADDELSQEHRLIHTRTAMIMQHCCKSHKMAPQSKIAPQSKMAPQSVAIIRTSINSSSIRSYILSQISIFYSQ